MTCMYHSYGIDLTPALYCDTIMLKHTLDEERPFGLKDISVKYFGDDAADEQLDLKENVIAKGGKWTQKQKDMYMADLNILGKYACKDVDLTMQLFGRLDNELYTEGMDNFFYNTEVMPLYRKATIPMKINGLYIDVPYFLRLKKEVEDGILKLTDEIFDEISDDIKDKVNEILDKYVRTSRTGQFAERVLQRYNLPVPLNKKTGKPTLAKTALRSLEAEYPNHPALEWLLWTPPTIEVEKVTEDGEIVKEKVPDPDALELTLPDHIVYDIKKEIYVAKNPDKPYVFNLSSNKHLAWLLFEKYGVEPKSKSRKTGEPQVDKNSLGEFDLPFIPKLAHLKKEEKLLSTYIIPILEKHIDGWIYPSMLQFGTTSGRYSCGGGLNLQTLPRDDTRIKQGFIAPPGHKIVSADFSSLEPRIFAWVSNDPGLKRVYEQGLDLYSQIAIDVFGLDADEYSADPAADNFLKKLAPEWRNKSKVFTLAVVYGANAYRITSIMGIPNEEAQDIIDKYLNAYPNLKLYMENQEEDALTTGKVYTNFGRVRHLGRAKELYQKFRRKIFYKGKMKKEVGEKEGSELYYEFRTLMNNSKNFPIQGTAAHVTNASLIMFDDLTKRKRLNCWPALQIHDEIVAIAPEKEAGTVAKLLKHAMEKNPVAEKIDIPMIAEPQIGANLAEVK